MKPLVSICVPIYNVKTNYLQELLDSIQKQTYDNIEVVISDDASATEYVQIIHEYSSKIKLVYSKNRRNLGMVGNWNHVVKLSSGELTIVVGQDDYLHFSMIEDYVKQFGNNPELALCACARRFINENGQEFQPKLLVNDRSRIFVKQPQYFLTHTQVVKLCLRNGNPIGEPSAVMFKREIFEKITGFDPEFNHAADVDFIIRASSIGKVVYLNYPYLFRRRHDTNLTISNFKNGHVSYERVKLYKKYADSALYSKDNIYRFKVSLVSHAIDHLLKAIRECNIKVLKINVMIIMKYSLNPVRYYIEHFREILSRENIDLQ